jgi:hypothetical protein
VDRSAQYGQAISAAVDLKWDSTSERLRIGARIGVKTGIQRAGRSYDWSEDHGGHCREGGAEDEASVVDDGGVLEEDVDVDLGGADADLCDSSCVRLCITFGVRMEATDGGQSEQAGALRAAQQGGHRTGGIILRDEEECM